MPAEDGSIINDIAEDCNRHFRGVHSDVGKNNDNLDLLKGLASGSLEIK